MKSKEMFSTLLWILSIIIEAKVSLFIVQEDVEKKNFCVQHYCCCCQISESNSSLLLRDLLHQNDLPFAGTTVLYADDFHHTLPVVPRALCQEIVGASIARSNLWRHMEVHHLTQNMRLDRAPESEAHAAWLLEIDAGTNCLAIGNWCRHKLR